MQRGLWPLYMGLYPWFLVMEGWSSKRGLRSLKQNAIYLIQAIQVPLSHLHFFFPRGRGAHCWVKHIFFFKFQNNFLFCWIFSVFEDSEVVLDLLRQASDELQVLEVCRCLNISIWISCIWLSNIGVSFVQILKKITCFFLRQSKISTLVPCYFSICNITYHLFCNFSKHRILLERFSAQTSFSFSTCKI